MKITFVSNYINHHQIPFSNALYEMLGDEYVFVQTEPMEKERKRMGWEVGDMPPYVRNSYDDMQLVEKLLMTSDLVIFGGARDQEMVLPRIEAGKLTFRYSERIYKDGQWKFVSPRGLMQKYHDHVRFRKKPVYLLCAGGYVASDFHLIHAYPGKMLKFGYFPEFIDYKDAVHAKRIGIDHEILWAGRCIDWKHPEMAIEVMKRLKAEDISCHMTFIGGGDLLVDVHEMAEKEGVLDQITFTGFLKPEQVREKMRVSDIFLFTSDYREGWGAVMNEAMNAGCAVVANEGIGAAPYLIEPGKTGFVYGNGDVERCADLVKMLLQDPELRLRTGRLAYEKIRSEWNPQNAAGQVVALAEQLLGAGGAPKLKDLSLPEDGPCSIAELISPGLRH